MAADIQHFIHFIAPEGPQVVAETLDGLSAFLMFMHVG